MTDAPQYADPDRYIELAGFGGEWRDLFWNTDFLALMAHRWGIDDVRFAVDVGCGAGHWGRTVLRLLHPDARMLGIDREPAFFDLAREHAARCEMSGRVEFREGVAESLPLDDDCVDLITCQTVLIHVADARSVVDEMIRVLRPGGLLILAEPDNRAGNLALLNASPSRTPEEIADIVRFQLVYERGKLELGEGDNSIGGQLPGMLHACGLDEVRAHTNDRCIHLAPPYDTHAMKTSLEMELAWVRDEVSILVGTESDSRRFYRAGGGDDAEFDRVWGIVRQTMRDLEEGVAAGTYHAGRGFVMYLVSGRKPI